MFSLVFFFNDTATTEIYTLSLHDALPISLVPSSSRRALTLGEPDNLTPIGFCRLYHYLKGSRLPSGMAQGNGEQRPRDRKSTRLNSSHANISYAVFCLKKKKILKQSVPTT